MSDLVLKTVSPVRVVALRTIIGSYPEQGPLWREMTAFLCDRSILQAAPSLTLLHDMRPIDVEICVPVADDVDLQDDENERFKIRVLPEVEVAMLEHQGKMENIRQTYERMMKKLEEGGFTVVGPSREVYINIDNLESVVVEVQFPVRLT